MRRTLLAAGLGLCACPAPSTSAATQAGLTDDASATASSGPASGATATTTGEPDAWLELGWGISEWNAFEGVLPVVVGPQGLAMFSVPLRGKGFRNPDSPDLDDADVPVLDAWVDVEGYDESPGRHLVEVVDYPALFYPTMDDPELLEAPAVWMVIPDAVDPSELLGLPAHLHAELVDADGLALHDDRELAIGQPR